MFLPGRGFQQGRKEPLPEPVFGVLRRAFLPQLEVELILAGDGVHGTEYLPGLHLLAGLDGNGLKLAVEGEIGAVLDEDALVVARKYTGW